MAHPWGDSGVSARAARLKVTRGQPGHARRTARWADLLRQAGRGDTDAFAGLYDETSPFVYGIAMTMLRSPQLACALTQEVYADAWRQAPLYDPADGTVLAWLTAMAHRHFAERIRALGQELVPERYAVLNGERQFDRIGHEGGFRLDAEAARQALSSLSPTSREAVTLAYFGGYSQTEVARVLGLPLGTVKSSIREGLAALRAAMEGVS